MMPKEFNISIMALFLEALGHPWVVSYRAQFLPAIYMFRVVQYFTRVSESSQYQTFVLAVQWPLEQSVKCTLTAFGLTFFHANWQINKLLRNLVLRRCKKTRTAILSSASLSTQGCLLTGLGYTEIYIFGTIMFFFKCPSVHSIGLAYLKTSKQNDC